ncbi:type VII secretion protein, YukD family [Enterococcus faecium]|nr:type VII secretion protein, YukD family [Enterococcus faecium]
MEKGTTISISLHTVDRIIDLKVPSQVTVARLKTILQESFPIIHIRLPENFELALLNKPIHLRNEAILADYSLGNGDQLQVIERQKNREENLL